MKKQVVMDNVGNAQNNPFSNIPPEKLGKLLQMASKKTGTDPESLRQNLEKGNVESVLGSLSPKDAEKVSKALSNPAFAKQILSSPQAQELLKKLGGQ